MVKDLKDNCRSMRHPTAARMPAIPVGCPLRQELTEPQWQHSTTLLTTFGHIQLLNCFLGFGFHGRRSAWSAFGKMVHGLMASPCTIGALLLPASDREPFCHALRRPWKAGRAAKPCKSSSTHSPYHRRMDRPCPGAPAKEGTVKDSDGKVKLGKKNDKGACIDFYNSPDQVRREHRSMFLLIFLSIH